MNKSKQISFSALVLLLCLISTAAYGQKQSKTYEETFNVTPETVLDINTSNADIEFETWDKSQIQIEAVIELEGASDEEADRYFEDGGVDIIGNSKRVSVSTSEGSSWLFSHSNEGFPSGQHLKFDHDFHFNIDPVIIDHSIFEMDSLSSELFLLEEMPPMPPMPYTNFDYDAFKKDGEKYLKEWQKEFSKGFDKEYEKKLEEWGKRIEERSKEMEKRQKEMAQARAKQAEARAQALEKRMEKREEERAKRLEKEAKARQKALEKRAEAQAKRNENRSVIISRSRNQNGDPNIFYFSNDGQHKNYKVKKTIKIKMPKATKIQMNVRHGEVKLAENTQNIDATLSYSSLRAATIDGEETTIVASYSPVTVKKWNYGQLQADYSEEVNLQEVVNLRLSATSSDVTIERLLDKAYIKNNFGPLKINYVSKNFTDLDISLQNAELQCKTPTSAFAIYVNGTSSEFACPADLQLDRTKNQNTIVHRGYHVNKDNGKNIVINSKYSEVVFD